MKKTLLIIAFTFCSILIGQEVRILKGAITENIVVNDSIDETFSLYLPTDFDIIKTWPVIFVFDLDGKGKSALSMLKNAADKEGYILAASNQVHDSLSIAKNVLIANRMFNAVIDLVPIAKGRTYVAGFGRGARFASVVPTFIKEIKGVVSIGAPVANAEILSSKRSFQFVGVVNRNDYNFREMEMIRNVLDKIKFPNNLIVFDAQTRWPDISTMALAMQILTLNSMQQDEVLKDEKFVQKAYADWLVRANSFIANQQPILANYALSDMYRIFHPIMDIDSLKQSRKTLRKSPSFKKAKRSQNSYFLKEEFTKEDVRYYLEEDILSYNYANLGWWKYQMEELDKLDKSKVLFENQMSARLRGYINAVIEDEIDFISADNAVDLEAIDFLYMLKTITSPKAYKYYLKLISNSARIEDYGTALFYLEELLKNGYTNKKELYALPNTALFRITPQFNEIVEKYLKESRYDIIEQ